MKTRHAQQGLIKSKLNLSVVLYAFALPINASAASADEIQVYDDAINHPGELNVDVHMNYVISGIKDSGYPKEIPANHNFRITPEFGYGLTKTLEAGLYLPAIRSGNGDWYLEGVKLRLKYLAEHAELGSYWGINFELGKVSHRTSEESWNLEARPIIGYRTEAWNFTVNPILGFAVSGSDHTPTFEPAIKVGHKFTEKTWINIENYSDFGAVDNMRSHVQETYITADTEVFGHDLNIGLGRGWTNQANDWTLKAIFNIPL
ncbi:MAG: hypothetical protein ACKVOA_10560 [Methylophilaceae bacterium]